MKVYIHCLILGCCSVLLTGCGDRDENTIKYQIEQSGSHQTTSGSIALGNLTDIAYINQLTGSVMLDGTVAIKGDIIHENTSLATLSGAEAEIIFLDNSIVHLFPNSVLHISRQGTGNTILNLGEGGLWARVLSPFTDLSFFTIKTDDLSAGVRGTSVWLLTNSGGTDIGVVDTTTSPMGHSGAVIDIIQMGYTGSKIHLSGEEILRVRHARGMEYKKMKLKEQMEYYPFVGMYTIRDIRYMHQLLSEPGIAIGMLDRIEHELRVTVPNKEESRLFVSDSVIQLEMQKSEKNNLTSSQFIYYLDLDTRLDTILHSDISPLQKEKDTIEIRKLIPLAPISPVSTEIKTGTISPPLIPSLPTKPASSSTIYPLRTSGSSISGEKSILCVAGVSGELCR